LGLAQQFSAASAAVLYAAFAAALLALAHRLVTRMSRRAALALALLPLCFTGCALLTGRIYAPVDLAYSGEPLAPHAAEYGIGDERKGVLTDIYSAILPWRQAVRYAWSQGEWPLWNPFILCGDPLSGSAQPAPYYPVNALSLLVPFALAFTFGATAQLLVSALAAFLYFRDLGEGGCRELAAFVGAAGWAFSSFLAAWLEWPLGAAVALTPFVVLGARRVVRQPGWSSGLLLALGLTLTIFAGHPESVIHVVAVGAVFGIAEAVSARRDWRAWRSIAGWTAAGGALALALSAIYLLPLVEALRQTLQWLLRQGATTIAEGLPAEEAWRRLMGSVMPSLYNEARAGSAPYLITPLFSAYVGSVLWGPALYGLVRGRWRGRFLLAAVGLGGVLAGARMPGFYPFLGRLPLFSMALNERLVFAGAFATAGLAALGVDAWLRAMEGGYSRGARDVLGFAGACVTAAAGYAAILVWLFPHSAESGYPQRELEQWLVWSLVPLLAAALVAVLALVPRLSRRAGVLPGVMPGVLAAVLAAVLLVQRTGEMGSFYPTVPARAFYPRVAPLDALPTDSDVPWRFVGQDFQMIPNQGTHYGIEDVRGYQAILHHRFADLVPLWATPMPSWYLAVHRMNRPFLSLMNVRYAMTAGPRRVPGWREVASGRSSKLWENPEVLPRAFVPRRVRIGVPPYQEIEEMKGVRDFRGLAWIVPPESDQGGEGAPRSIGNVRDGRDVRNGPGWVNIRRRGLGFEMTARMRRRAGWVVITETAWKGWRARIDGREVPVGIGDHAFLALSIPKGQHKVELFYRPRSFELGLGLSAAALTLIAAVSLLRTRRKPVSTSSDRRTGDRIAIPGEYQYRALHHGPAPQRFWHRAKLEEALALLRLAPGDRMLDAGCGSGILAAMASEVPMTPRLRVLGVDANPAAIEFGSRTFDRPNLSFRLGLVDELDELNEPPGSFEKISFLEVIEHLSRAQGETILAQFAHLLAPGGRLVLTTPNRRSPWPLLEWLLDRLRLVPQLSGEQHEVLYDLDELRAMGEAAGLALAEHRMIDTVAPWLAGWPRLARLVHRAEVRLIRRHGCVMVLAFEKPADAPVSATPR
jgi:2-polyprenyl-3-methyl-5-hydroxy-6-metoxy-1,4-benzoquinol methylase